MPIGIFEKTKLAIVGYKCEDCEAEVQVQPGEQLEECPHCHGKNLYAVVEEMVKQ